ncbi:tRNA modification GTPase trmE [Dethiosulfatibacter aminovorans DSM 17477]|uniref:tRNA modification GTPase MnmE n=1 Tax=Dethiosulfatibacter aminovorans DSM 17477 TaxID=1121476 RepID=A0A1M6AKZ9_9FIRM|nr:tRNA uridine-5-carboxymethylaminomethyl(34) synthesis GTPase MnmE [Dethiosulfatibacter aminovorans]SHI37142.1 tRNA modification GTPase trmE [Dethiosulfatibacter aminovorans DSM 17477]
MNTDTIAASATYPGMSGIGIVRVSGKDAIGIVSDIFKSKNGKKLSELKNRMMYYGWIVDPEKDKVADEVLVVAMKGPNTFTKEDVVEINCHGGIVSVEMILGILISRGARLAERGEFTKRAFLNGRIDLTQAEAVMDLVSSKTRNSFDLSLHQLEGRLSKEIRNIRQSLMDLISQIEVNIDFPEYDEEEMTVENIKNISREILKRFDKLIKSADTGKIYKEGIKTLILGKPNVGKSSLMNYLLNENRAIVTEIPGTTRDTIEEFVNLAGVPLKIIDTAGIRYTDDEVEKIGVKKALDKINEADLILMIFDASKALEGEDIMIIKEIQDKKVLYLLNKTDLPEKIDFENFHKIKEEVIKVSIKGNRGLEKIENKIKEEFLKGALDVDDDIIVSNMRHKNLLMKARKSIEEVLESIEKSLTLECLEVDIMNSLEFLGEITGESVRDDLIDKIFTEFCIGK